MSNAHISHYIINHLTLKYLKTFPPFSLQISYANDLWPGSIFIWHSIVNVCLISLNQNANELCFAALQTALELWLELITMFKEVAWLVGSPDLRI